MVNLRNKLTSLFSTFGLLLGLLAVIPLTLSFPTASHAYSSCTAASATAVPQKTTIGSNFELTPSHGQSFYVDFSKTPNLNASYIGYKVKNISGAAINNIWVKLSGFSSATPANNLLSLANSADYKMQIPTLGIGEEKTVYFLIAASRASILSGGSRDATTTQKHTVEIYNGDPDAQTPSIAGGCDFIFKQVTDVIEAAANKVTSVSVNNATPTLGELVTVTAQGTPGTLGSGDSGAAGDRDIVWLSPSAIKTFPTRALRLESVRINYGTVNGGCQVEYVEQLLMTGMSTCIQNVTYTATYKFRVIGSSASSVTLAPIANIASGTQVKHTDGSSATATINLANVATSSKFTIAKTTSVSDSVASSPNVSVPYSIKVTNTGTSDLTLDYVLDDPSAGTYINNSGSYVITNKGSAGSSVSINPSLRSDSNYYFVGPFTIPAATSNNGTDSFITINYRMLLPLAASGQTITYTNSASAFVGSQRVSSASSITLTVNDTGAQGVAVAPTATTNAATSVTATAATLNGSFTVGGSTISAKFAYSTTSADVSSAVYTSTSSGNLVIVDISGSSTTDSDTSTALSGLTAGSTYYFKIMVANTSNTYAYGEVLNFQTGVPSATTTSASSITTTSASINGTVGTGGDSGSKYYFIYGTSPDLTGATTSSETVISGASVTLNWTGLTAGTTYYFRVVAKNSTGAIVVNGDILSFRTLVVTTFDPNNGTLASGNVSDTSTATISTDGLLNKPATDPSRSGYTFSGWSLTSTGSVVTSHTLTGSQTYYAIWSAASSGGGSPPPPPPPVYIPHPPTITSISVPEMCAIGEQLIIKGTYLSGATATLDGVKVRIGGSSFNELVLLLPAAPVGTKTIVVTNVDGSANATLEYKFVDSPVYVNFIYPSTYQGQAFTYTFTATNTEKYSIQGVLPAGLTLDPLTGEISGTPTKAGNYLFTIVASNFCDQTYLDVYMFVDKAIPQTYTCTVPFLSPRSDAVSEFRLTQLRKCLDDIYTLSPATVAPVIFISGGLRSGLTIEQSLTHPRYLPILSLITSMNLNAQIYLGAFSGELDAVQLNIYWPMP